MRLVVLVDGEHYPPVLAAAIGHVRSSGHDVVCAVHCGGAEKAGDGDLSHALGLPVLEGAPPPALLRDAIGRYRPDAVLDLSDEPVLSDRDRFELAGVALHAGVDYTGSDFELRAPQLEAVLTKPSVRVIATGKRTGKTAVSAALARRAAERGHSPVIVAMGRGGPPEPQIVEAGTALGPDELLELADAGLHAASDYLEDAVTTGATTIGCRRVGGGLAGVPFLSNVAEGARIAEGREEDVVILEGSGSAVPPVAAHAGLLCLPAGHATIGDHLGTYRLLLADVAVVTMAEEEGPAATTERVLSGLASHLHIVRAAMRPLPLRGIAGRSVFLCTTAPPRVGPVLRRHLEESFGCEVAGMSHALADRPTLRGDLRVAADHEVLLTELKGAAVDVAMRHARDAGREIVIADNVPTGPGVAQALDLVLDLSQARASES